MLNPKLVEEYGVECKPFFNELVKRVDPDTIDKCYAIVGLRVESGDLKGPQWVGVIADYDTVRKVNSQCIHITIDLKDKTDERDVGILAISSTEEDVEEEGIKIWVQ